ncbi:T-cell surface antigen CD2 [Channa argus]|uniref:T-cell surface antigen CD2 n=1 Tax=Channa argus TaxID=215402 RepID=A0A6G1QUE9_CHAAH|nr:T-cell surface antigen CD2 [Channa argus]KAK2880416.1 hypothetical protein Q8A73_023114 [Channa argus]
MSRMATRMAAVSTITLLLLSCSVITSTGSSDKCDGYVVTGGEYLVQLKIKDPSSVTLKWLLNNTVIFQRRKGLKVVTGKQDDVDNNGSLKLKNVQKTMAGKYSPQVYEEDGTLLPGLKDINLCVLDPVAKPTVTLSCSKDKSKITFSCSNVKATDNSVEWLMNEKVLKEKGTSITKDAKQVENDSFRCNISNPASSAISDSVKQKCFTSPLIPERLFGVSIWIFVGCGAGIVLLLIIIVIVCCIYARRKKKTIKMDEEELRLGWTSEQQQQQQLHHHHHHHPPHQQHQHHQHNHPPDHHHHHQQQPAGHTGPRQHRSKQHREARPRAPEPSNGRPQPSPRRNAEGPRPVVDNDDEQPPPLPQPRKKTPKV